MTNNIDSTAIAGQDVYSIYAGDAQVRTPQDQGPMQNAAVDKGGVTVALRSLYTDATSASYYAEVIADAYDELVAPHLFDGGRFNGTVGMGDYLDLGCEQEKTLLEISLGQLFEDYPQFHFTLMALGNHDGGYYMGVTDSAHNFLGIVGLAYEDMVFDARSGSCGEEKYIEETHEALEDIDAYVRGNYDKATSFDDVVTEITRAGKKSFKSNGIKYKFKDDGKVYDLVWLPTPNLNRWDAVMHVSKTPFETGHAEKVDDNKKDQQEVSHSKNDTREWIGVQAHKDAEFELQDGRTVPVYSLALDSQDKTSYSASHATVKGHVSEFQISVVESFIEHMLALNPLARFKLIMHYPVDSLVCSSLAALKRLLNRDEIILVATAHTHERGYNSDIRDEFNLKRKTPLPWISVGSTTDEMRDVVVEKMSLVEENGQANIKFVFEYHRMTEDDFVSPENRDTVISAVNDLEDELVRRKKLAYEEISTKIKSSKRLVDFDDNPRWIYLNEDEVIAELNDPLLKIVANGKADRQLQVWTALKLFIGLGKDLTRKFTSEVSIPQMIRDFESFQVYLDILLSLYREDDAPMAKVMGDRVSYMKLYFQFWLSDYKRRRDQKIPDSALRFFNNLYTSSDMQGIFEMIARLPRGSKAWGFANIVGTRASAEEARYHGYVTAATNTVPDVIEVAVDLKFD